MAEFTRLTHPLIAKLTEQFKDDDDSKIWIMRILNGHVVLPSKNRLSFYEDYVGVTYQKIVPITDLIDFDDLEEDKANPEFLKDRAYDMACDLSWDEELPEGLLLDKEDDADLYLDRHHSDELVYIDREAGVVFMQSTSYYDIRGEKFKEYNKLDVNLIKFRERKYDSPENYRPLEDGGIDQFDSLVYVLDDGAPHINREIDTNLLEAWCRHQITSKVFECIEDPFYEKDGMIHQKHRGYGPIAPKYKEPKGVSARAFSQRLFFCEQWASNQSLFAREK